MTVYNAATGAESVEGATHTLYKVSGEVLPGDFQEMRIEANHDLTEAEVDQLFALVSYSWVTTARGQEFDMLGNDHNSFVVDAILGRSFSHDPQGRAKEFVDGLNGFIASGSPQRKRQNNTRAVEGMPGTKVTVWVSDVVKENS